MGLLPEPPKQDEIDSLPEKPAYKEPCNGCGQCCAIERCHVATEILGEGPGPCPLMKYEEGEIRCSLLLIEKEYEMIPLLSLSLGVGRGCHAGDLDKDEVLELRVWKNSKKEA